MKFLLCQRRIKLQKVPGKGGWTFALLPADVLPHSNPYRWMVVDLVIDNYEFKDFKLMPVKDNFLFVPVRASIRKQIGKEAGDFVNIKIYASNKISDPNW